MDYPVINPESRLVIGVRNGSVKIIGNNSAFRDLMKQMERLSMAPPQEFWEMHVGWEFCDDGKMKARQVVFIDCADAINEFVGDVDIEHANEVTFMCCTDEIVNSYFK